MRSYATKFVLLAVISNLASAGLVRYHDRPIRGVNHIRAFNQSSLSATSFQPAESTSKSSATPSSLTTSSAFSPTSSTATSTSKQIGSVPALGSGPGAATIDLESLTRTSASATLAPVSSSSTLTTSNIQQSQSALDAASSSPVSLASSTSSLASPETTLATRLSLGTSVATPASPSQRSQVQSPSSATTPLSLSAEFQTSFSGIAQSSQFSAQTSVPSPPSSGSAVSSTQGGLPSVSNTPATSGGNLAQALDFNKFFKTLTSDSSCSSGDKTQGHACINGLFATCSSAGHYLTFACDQGQQCFALPRPAPELGVFIQCDTPGGASRKLQGANANTSGTTAPKTSATPKFGPTTSSTPKPWSGNDNETSRIIEYPTGLSDYWDFERHPACSIRDKQRCKPEPSTLGVDQILCIESHELDGRAADHLGPVFCIIVVLSAIRAAAEANKFTGLSADHSGHFNRISGIISAAFVNGATSNFKSHLDSRRNFSSSS
ncbi:MAG: hypothetical protein Q9194_002973 [Teloschistes cf. exilis]